MNNGRRTVFTESLNGKSRVVPNTWVAFGTAAYVPYAVIATPARSGRAGLPRIIELEKIAQSQLSAAVRHSVPTALRGRSNHVSGHDASVPKPTHGFPIVRGTQSKSFATELIFLSSSTSDWTVFIVLTAMG